MSKIRMDKEILYSPYHNVYAADIVMGEKPLQWQCITSSARDSWDGVNYTRWRIAICTERIFAFKEGNTLLYAYINRKGGNVNLLIKKSVWNEESQQHNESYLVDPIPLKQIIGPNFNTSTKRGLKKVAKRVAALFQK